MKTAIILYEMGQLALLDALIAKWSEEGQVPQVVSLDAEIDFALEKRGIPFISGKTLQNRTAPSAYIRAEEMTREVFTNKALSFLRYRGVSAIESLRFSTHVYLASLLYYVDIIDRLMEGASDMKCLVVPTSVAPASKTSDVLAIEESKVVYEAAHLVAEKRGIHCELHDTLSTTLHVKNRLEGWVFTTKRALFVASLALLNIVISTRPHRPLRVLASDYWRNISPIMRELPEAELILIDRTQALHAGLKNIWRHKLRFFHINRFLSLDERRRAIAHANMSIKEWMTIRKNAFASIDLTFCGTDLRITMDRVVTHLIQTALPDIISDIEGAYILYQRLSPNAVLLRASVSRQRHFSILALVARESGIPAFEVQHGGEYLGPGSGTREHVARFFATYGPLVCEEFRTLGYEKERLLPVGSPRFDAYMRDAQKKVVARERKPWLVILSNTPTLDISERYGTYSVEEYFKTLGEATRHMPNARLFIASRSTTVRSAFLAEARARGLAGVNYESVGTTPLPELFRQADIFVCSYSTVVYEALLYRLPIILAAFAPVEKMMADFHFSHFEKAGALRIAHSPEELSEMLQKLSASSEARESMSKAGWEFMQKNFSFDGHASERIAELVRGWSKRATA